MKCSMCRTELVLGEGTKVYETLLDHVCDPNEIPPPREYYVCPNNRCQAGGFWDLYGEFYGQFLDRKEFFINKLSQAFGSCARKAEVEIKKHDEDFDLFTLFNKLKFAVHFKYKADEDGNILKRTWHIQIFYRNKSSWLYYTSGIHMFFFCIKSFYYHKRVYLKNKSFAEQLLESCHRPDWDKRWWSLSSSFILRNLNKKFLRTI